MTVPGVVRAVTRPLRRARRVLATTDPDRSRLRLASTTMATLVVVAGVLFVGAAATGQPVTAVVPGVVLAMIASMAVREVAPGPRAATIALLVPASLVSIALAALLAPWVPVVDAVFVVVAVASVFLRAIGPSGTALGMLAFMSYFLAVFVRITPQELPVVAAAQLVAAGLTILIRWLLAPRHADHDVERMLAALGLRARRVVDVLADGLRVGRLDERLLRTVRSRLAASSATASSVQGLLESAEEPVLSGLGNDELGVRVLDFQLTMERLVDAVRQLLDPGYAPPAVRQDLVPVLGAFTRVLDAPARAQRSAAEGIEMRTPSSEADSDPRVDRIGRIVAFGVEAWHGIAAPGTSAPGGSDDDDAREESAADDADHRQDDSTAPAAPLSRRLRDMGRQATQVGIAAALAIGVGTAISSTRWFWAVIAAFVVYVGTSTRGEILTKGWLRVVGTLAGVVVGVIVAALVGGDTALAVVLIVVCLFAGVYLVSVSSALMIFFITTMLALLYGLLGEFSVGLLLTRLTETAAGAAIGVGVAYVVLPTSTRGVARERMRDHLEALAEAVTHAVDRLTQTSAVPAGAPGADEARTLRSTFEALRTAATPLTTGFAGIGVRTGSRRTMQILAVCEYHCRALLRIADGGPGIADTEALRRLFAEVAVAVRADIQRLATAAGAPAEPGAHEPAAAALDALEVHPDLTASRHRTRLEAAAADLRAMDRAVRDRTEEVGVAPVAPDGTPVMSRA